VRRDAALKMLFILENSAVVVGWLLREGAKPGGYFVPLD
jgi:hypothetical protein